MFDKHTLAAPGGEQCPSLSKPKEALSGPITRKGCMWKFGKSRGRWERGGDGMSRRKECHAQRKNRRGESRLPYHVSVKKESPWKRSKFPFNWIKWSYQGWVLGVCICHVGRKLPMQPPCWCYKKYCQPHWTEFFLWGVTERGKWHCRIIKHCCINKAKHQTKEGTPVKMLEDKLNNKVLRKKARHAVIPRTYYFRQFTSKIKSEW